jgi:uncharacterized protein involved in outer membrane biogenesis
MPKPLKVALFVAGGLVVLLIVFAAVLSLFIDANDYKERFEATASGVLRLDISVEGGLAIAVFPRLLVTMQNVHVRNGSVEIVFAREATLGIDVFHLLLHRQLRFTSIALQHAKISVERNSEGRYNFVKNEFAKEPLRPLEVASVSMTDAALHYANAQSGVGFEAAACSVDMRHVLVVGGKRADFARKVSFTAELTCGEFGKNDVTVSDFKLSVNGKDGVFDLDPITMPLFGAQGMGSFRADFSDTVPQYQVRFSLPKFRIEEVFKTLSPQKVAEGAMDFTATLAMHGKTAFESRQTLQGQMSLRGENLMLDGNDLDEKFSRFEATQNFNLLDVGAFFLAGPLGVVVTKGYNFASLLQGSGGGSEIRTLVSDWKVEAGVAQAQDVAMATRKNRVAAHGGLDFVNEQFNDVTIALIDAKGCVKVEQKVHGTFHEPVVEKPNVLQTLTGPALELIKKGRSIFPGGECEVFYAGSVLAPT